MPSDQSIASWWIGGVEYQRGSQSVCVVTMYVVFKTNRIYLDLIICNNL